MTNYSTGHNAEKIAADYLQDHGFTVQELNWKTRYCEIDIVAEKNKVMYFVEVKYRKNDYQGTGFDYITSKKLKQMAFAAELWVQENTWKNSYQLAAIELTGDPEVVSCFLTDLA